MTGTRRIWLVVNSASGSNDREALAGLERCCTSAGFTINRVISFPDQPLPTGESLDAAGIALAAVFAGDGTVNALVAELAGWGGAVLVLPGGTMNLLYHRLHADRSMEEVIRLAAGSEVTRTRPCVIRCDAGTALADLLAGPGTTWHEVREAMREADLVAVAANAAQAIGATLAAPGVACLEPEIAGRQEYPLIMLTPTAGGIKLSGFRAGTAGEYLKESLAVLQRRFREGPHDDLGVADRVALASSDGKPLSLLIDGEPADSPTETVFRLVPCGVDLLASEADGR